jgi:hypothetical protein
MKRVIVSLLMICGLLAPSQQVAASELPKVTSFDFSPKEVELTGPDTTITFELVVQHPLGIENSSTIVTLTGPRNSTVAGYLTRINQIGKYDSNPVTFKGSIELPRNIAEGSYSISAKGISNFNSKGYQYSTGDISPANFRKLVGSENTLLVRLSGEANISYTMFAGPTYDTLSSISFKDTNKYNRQKTPILRVGETYNPNDYFESYVPEVPLNISSSTPNICSVEGVIMKFLATGNCQFKVFTKKTKDYAAQSSDQSVTVAAARRKSTFIVNEIPAQSVKDLPITLALPMVYSAAAGYVLPTSITPAICIATAFSVRIISGGTCTLTYQTKETSDFLASELYKQNIEIPRNPQTISFTPPATAPISSKTLTLTATASSGGSVIFSTTSQEVCKSEGNLLTLLKSGPCVVTASQAGTTTISPISISQTISITGNKPKRASTICVRKGKQIEITKSKCPKGYKKSKA